MISFDFWVVGVSFSFRGHDTDTYRTVSLGHGAFELCLPSLGFFLTKLTLRFCIWANVGRMTKVRTWRVDLYKIYKVARLVGECAYHVMHHQTGSHYHYGQG